MAVKSIELLFTSWFVSHRTLTTRTPDSWNPHEYLALSAKYSVIVRVQQINGPDRIRTGDLLLRKQSHYPSYATSPKSFGNVRLIWIAIS